MVQKRMSQKRPMHLTQRVNEITHGNGHALLGHCRYDMRFYDNVPEAHCRRSACRRSGLSQNQHFTYYCRLHESCYLFGHLHGELLMRNAFGERAVFLSRIRIQVIMNPRQDALLKTNRAIIDSSLRPRTATHNRSAAFKILALLEFVWSV